MGTTVRTWNAYPTGVFGLILGGGLAAQTFNLLFAWQTLVQPTGKLVLLVAFSMTMIVMAGAGLYGSARLMIGGVKIACGHVSIVNPLRSYDIPIAEVVCFRVASSGLSAGSCEVVRRDGTTVKVPSITQAPIGDCGTSEKVERLNACLSANLGNGSEPDGQVGEVPRLETHIKHPYGA